MVEPLAGSSGLLEFMSLDLGAVLAIRDPDRSRRELRIIAGNPVTMSKMTATVPDAGLRSGDDPHRRTARGRDTVLRPGGQRDRTVWRR